MVRVSLKSHHHLQDALDFVLATADGGLVYFTTGVLY